MSGQITLVASEPAPAPMERMHRSEVVSRAGGQTTVEQPAPSVSTSPLSGEKEAPELRVAVDTIRNHVSDMKRELQFSLDEESGRTIITVIDRESGKIIRQIPPKELLQIAQRVAEGGKINLIDSRA